MPVSEHIAERLKDRVRLALGTGRLLSREQERAVYLDAIASDIALEDARALVESVIARRRARRASEIDDVLYAVMATRVGNRGWLSRSDFERAAVIYRSLSQDTIDRREARARIKRMMIENGWTVRGAVVFGTPKWFRDVPYG
jgi:hypothetical protein